MLIYSPGEVNIADPDAGVEEEVEVEELDEGGCHGFGIGAAFSVDEGAAFPAAASPEPAAFPPKA